MSTLVAIAVAVLAQAAGARPSAGAPRASDPSTVHVSARELQRGIRCTAPGDCVVTRALVDHLLADSATLAGAARVVPSLADGKPAGFELYAVRPRSWLDRIGAQNGDTLEAVNGYELTTPAQALLAYASLRDETRFAVRIVRHGEPITLHIEIR